MGDRALVLGGGGVTGIAWELGIIAGLIDLGVDLRDADLVVGTSAGSTVGAQILGTDDIEALYAEQTSGPGKEIRPPSGATLGFMARLAVMMLHSRFEKHENPLRTYGMRAGAFAKKVHTISPAERLAVIESRLPSLEWPGGRLLITAVNAETGERRVFDRRSGVGLLDAVAASCAVPGVWPPVLIGEELCIDGGVCSPANADLAVGSERIVALAPLPRGGLPGTSVDEQIGALGGGISSVIIIPDKPVQEAIGRNPLDPRSRVAAAQAGRGQAARVVDLVASVWNT